MELVYIDPPGENVQRQFHDFLQINILSSQPPEIARRVLANPIIEKFEWDILKGR